MTHSNDVQCRPVRLDQYVNQDIWLIFKAQLVFIYSRKYGTHFVRVYYSQHSKDPFTQHAYLRGLVHPL